MRSAPIFAVIHASLGPIRLRWQLLNSFHCIRDAQKVNKGDGLLLDQLYMFDSSKFSEIFLDFLTRNIFGQITEEYISRRPVLLDSKHDRGRDRWRLSPTDLDFLSAD